MTPARRHFQLVTAGAEAIRTATAAAGADADTPLHDRMLALLQAHRLNLKSIKSRALKIETKRKFLPDYAAYVDGVLAADAGGSNLVLVIVMVWRVDVGDYAGALAIADHAIRHRLELPDGVFKRDLATTVVEEIATAVLEALAASTPLADGAAGALEKALDLTESHDMPDEVRSKAYKALGLLWRESTPGEALKALRLALSLDPKCGVKTEIGRLERQLAGAAPSPDPDAGAGPTE